MKRLLKIIAILIVVPVVLIGGIVLTGNSLTVINMLFAPPATVSTETKAPAPDYGDDKNWASLPWTQDLADLTPEGVAPREEDFGVDVFFIHPTGFLKGVAWNYHMDAGSNSEENTKWMMANQASAYNGCCEVYAPRYRQANIFSYMAEDRSISEEALAFAFADVERAFDHFIDEYSRGRPFIIASHSQGTHHAFELLKSRISGSELRERMIAAYIIGGGTSHEDLAELPDLEPCDAPDDLHCVIHFATYGDGGSSDDEWMEEKTQVCTNPLSWRNEGPRTEASLHKGAVSTSGDFTIEFWGKDEAKDIDFGPLGAPIPGHTWAECIDGDLIIADQSDTAFGAGAIMGGKNYHGLDYPMFHMDIRENAILRSHAYLSARADAEEIPTE